MQLAADLESCNTRVSNALNGIRAKATDARDIEICDTISRSMLTSRMKNMMTLTFLGFHVDGDNPLGADSADTEQPPVETVGIHQANRFE